MTTTGVPPHHQEDAHHDNAPLLLKITKDETIDETQDDTHRIHHHRIHHQKEERKDETIDETDTTTIPLSMETTILTMETMTLREQMNDHPTYPPPTR